MRGTRFFNDSRPEAYVQAAAELAWTRTLAFLRRYLIPVATSSWGAQRPRWLLSQLPAPAPTQ